MGAVEGLGSEGVEGQLRVHFPPELPCLRTSQPSSAVPQQGVGEARPYLRVQENCWALTVHPDGVWKVEYDL